MHCNTQLIELITQRITKLVSKFNTCTLDLVGTCTCIIANNNSHFINSVLVGACLLHFSISIAAPVCDLINNILPLFLPTT